MTHTKRYQRAERRVERLRLNMEQVSARIEHYRALVWLGERLESRLADLEALEEKLFRMWSYEFNIMRDLVPYAFPEVAERLMAEAYGEANV